MESDYFAYGSNMNFKQMQLRCPGAFFAGTAKLNNWKYYINSDGYAGIEESSSDFVLGCLWKLTDRNWQTLDQYEAVDEGFYFKKKISVFSDKNSSEINAVVYLSTNSDYGIPTKSYQQGVLDGACEVGLPEDYIFSLRNWGE
jgi:hypothetical protein